MGAIIETPSDKSSTLTRKVNDGAWIVPIDKPAGLSSAQVVSRVKRGLSLKKVGHCGTLDPFATGVLVCVTGRATKLASFCEAGTKEYSGTIRLGIKTSTDDITGEVIESRDVDVLDGDISSFASKLTGELMQVPPAVSAIKINGQPAYQRVRKGEVVEISPRRITVEKFEVERLDKITVRYRVRCSKGTYIRSLARDLGVSLGCCATVETLVREYSSPFSRSQCHTLEQLGSFPLLPWWSVFPEMPRVALSEVQCSDLARGEQRFLALLEGQVRDIAAGSSFVIYHGIGGNPQGILTVSDVGVRCYLHLGEMR